MFYIESLNNIHEFDFKKRITFTSFTTDYNTNKNVGPYILSYEIINYTIIFIWVKTIVGKVKSICPFKSMHTY